MIFLVISANVYSDWRCRDKSGTDQALRPNLVTRLPVTYRLTSAML